MCRASTDPRGPKRCNNIEHLKALSIDELTPATVAGVPELAWSADDKDLDALWVDYSGRGSVVAAGVAVLQAHVEAESAVTAAMLEVVSGTDLRLAGLSSRLKSPASLVRKVGDRVEKQARSEPEPSPESIAGSLSDVLRFTVDAPDQNSITAALKIAVSRLRAAGLQVTDIDNKYQAGNSYKGVHLNVETADGISVEVQIHSTAGLAIKEESHMHYRLARDTNRSLVERQASMVKSANLYEQLSTPRGLNSLNFVEGIPVRKS